LSQGNSRVSNSQHNKRLLKLYQDQEQKALQELLVIQSQMAYISQFLSQQENMEDDSFQSSPEEISSLQASPEEISSQNEQSQDSSYEQQLQDFAQQLKELDQRQKEEIVQQQSQFQENQVEYFDQSSQWVYSEGNYYNSSLEHEYSISETPPYFIDTDESSCQSDSMEEVPVDSM